MTALTNGSNLTLYDATSVVAANQIWATGNHTTGNLNNYAVDLFDLPFSNGLTIVVAGGNLNALFIFE